MKKFIFVLAVFTTFVACDQVSAQCYRQSGYRQQNSCQVYSSPNVIYSSPNVIYSSPNVIYSSPNVIYSSPAYSTPTRQPVYSTPINQPQVVPFTEGKIVPFIEGNRSILPEYKGEPKKKEETPLPPKKLQPPNPRQENFPDTLNPITIQINENKQKTLANGTFAKK